MHGLNLAPVVPNYCLPVPSFNCINLPPSIFPIESASKDNNGMTALMWASAYGKTDILNALIAADGSPEHLNMKVRIFTHVACVCVWGGCYERYSVRSEKSTM